jgi:hypothetical protein
MHLYFLHFLLLSAFHNFLFSVLSPCVLSLFPFFIYFPFVYISFHSVFLSFLCCFRFPFVSFFSSFPAAQILFILGKSATSYSALSACRIKRRHCAPSKQLGKTPPAPVCRMNARSADVTMAPLFAERNWQASHPTQTP